MPELRIVLLEPEKGAEGVVSALRAGVDGYFHLGISAEALVYAIVTAVMGEPIVATRMVEPLLPKNGRPAPGQGRHEAVLDLTERERAILDCLVRGDPNKEIGRLFGVLRSVGQTPGPALLQKIGRLQPHSGRGLAMERTGQR